MRSHSPSSMELLQKAVRLSAVWEATPPAQRRYLLCESSSDSHLEVPRHTHDHIELMFFRNGHARFAVGSTTYRTKPGSILLIGAGQPHQMIFSEAQSTYERWTLYLTREYLLQIGQNMGIGEALLTTMQQEPRLLTPDSDQARLLQNILVALDQEQDAQNSFSAAMEDSLIGVLLTILCRVHAASAQEADPDETAAVSPLVSAILSYVQSHYTQSFSLADLAAEYHISKNHLMAQFKKEIGLSIYQHLLRTRLETASKLLMLGNAPTDIFEQCGFLDYTSFYRAFCKVYGCSPRNYLRTYYNQEDRL